MALSAGMGGGLGLGGAGGLMPVAPPPQFRSSTGPSDGGSASVSASRAGSGAASALGANDLQRVLTGDHCTTLSLCDDSEERVDVVTWNEEQSKCRALSSHSAVFSLTAAGAAKLVAEGIEATTPGTATAELPVGVSLVNGSSESAAAADAKVVKPLSLAFSKATREVDVLGSKVDATSLAAYVVAKCVEAGMPPSEEASSGGGGGGGGGGKKGKKKQTRSGAGHAPTVTLVVPCAMSFEQSVGASRVVQATGCALKNVFNRGIATVGYHVVSNRAGLGLDAASKEEAAAAAAAADLSVLYVHAASGGGAVEAALVQCELRSGSKAGRPSGKDVSRLWCAAVTSGASLSELPALVDALLKPYGGASALHASVVVSGDDAGATNVRKLLPSSVLFVRAAAAEAAYGGCLLSAAELDSSKQYAQLDDGSWTALYHLPVADGLLVSDVAWRVLNNEAEANAGTGKVEPAFSAGTRMMKKDLGTVRPSALLAAAPTAKKHFENKAGDEKAAWPRVELLCRPAGAKAEGWVVFGTIYPLSNGGQDGTGVESCTVVMSLDPATGHVRPVLRRGRLLRTLRESRQWWVRAALVVLAIIAAVVGIKMGLAWKEKRDFAEKVDWLADFYREHAPDKLQNMTQVERTVTRFQGKLWALQKQLESKYGVKMKKPAPESIGEL